MGILQEFKEFALKGNVVDMAVGIVIGAAFSTIVRSLVDDIIMPPMGLLMRGVDFSTCSSRSARGLTTRWPRPSRRARRPSISAYLSTI